VYGLQPLINYTHESAALKSSTSSYYLMDEVHTQAFQIFPILALRLFLITSLHNMWVQQKGLLSFHPSYGSAAGIPLPKLPLLYLSETDSPFKPQLKSHCSLKLSLLSPAFSHLSYMTFLQQRTTPLALSTAHLTPFLVSFVSLFCLSK